MASGRTTGHCPHSARAWGQGVLMKPGVRCPPIASRLPVNTGIVSFGRWVRGLIIVRMEIASFWPLPRRRKAVSATTSIPGRDVADVRKRWAMHLRCFSASPHPSKRQKLWPTSHAAPTVLRPSGRIGSVIGIVGSTICPRPLIGPILKRKTRCCWERACRQAIWRSWCCDVADDSCFLPEVPTVTGWCLLCFEPAPRDCGSPGADRRSIQMKRQA